MSQATSAAILRAVLRAGLKGIRSKDIAARLGLTQTTVQVHLIKLREAGQVEKSWPLGPHVRWGCPGIAEAAERALLARSPARWRERQARLGRKEGVSLGPVCEMRMPRVASVWELAALSKPDAGNAAREVA